jgi:hypothetical protein
LTWRGCVSTNLRRAPHRILVAGDYDYDYDYDFSGQATVARLDEASPVIPSFAPASRHYGWTQVC